ncbi:hypothetical protein BGZ95_001833 [Linnemannia exigua]|uniref:Uncharacterized protein n=1 Tax=Linnemannia exigua TaxID=604196 RepID=A0AAD4HA18_9FUNG|nr:hypothetical protein BGZ95_001833 [Linnemannia exigua]
MYLSDKERTLLFTTIRLALQTSFIFLISRIASRTYNLTTLERINGGFLSKLNFILFTKFPSRRKQYLGRFYVALALIVSLALNLVPFWLSELYTVEPIALESNIQPYNVSTQFIKITSLSPNRTNVDDILLGMAVSLDGSVFHNYSAIPAKPCPSNVCPAYAQQLFITATSEAAANIQKDLNIRGLNFTTSTGQYFEYFAMKSNAANSYALVEMFANMAQNGAFHTDRVIGSRSIETCLVRTLRNNRCVRHSLAFREDFDDLFLISRRVVTQTVVHFMDDDLPLYTKGNKYPIPDCTRFATPTLQTMCSHIISIGYPSPDGMYSLQQNTTTPNSIHYDVVISTLLPETVVNSMYWSLESFSLDIEVQTYTTNNTVNLLDITGGSNSTGLLKDEDRTSQGQELFEATYFVPSTIDLHNHSWADWGFSQEDKKNLTDFLFGGTMLNNGTLNVIKPDLLANVSEIVVGLLFGASLLMVLLGLVVSYGTPSVVFDPITEVLYQMWASKKDFPAADKKKSSMFTLRKRQVANLVLEPQQDGAAQFLENSSSSSDDPTQTPSSPLRPQEPYSTQRPQAINLRVEVGSDGEEDAIRLLEWRNIWQEVES